MKFIPRVSQKPLFRIYPASAPQRSTPSNSVTISISPNHRNSFSLIIMPKWYAKRHCIHRLQFHSALSISLITIYVPRAPPTPLNPSSPSNISSETLSSTRLQLPSLFPNFFASSKTFFVTLRVVMMEAEALDSGEGRKGGRRHSLISEFRGVGRCAYDWK